MSWLMLFGLLSSTLSLILLLALICAARHDGERLILVQQLQADSATTVGNMGKDDAQFGYIPLLPNSHSAYSA